ncbi:TetR/AcrR family transcriptional regulator [Sphingomonas sp. TDK1]|uniref:TetR/AcrR family transcriptional regulator n=1 Tax=Sphingomonas sp. TDK1 TaxID=453247 RepID=UPI0007D8ECA3|nr:TetR/AcrR family transcriptional regulator C-terminal domain-containing protein [Sphingomonas sp. TDK1]OAN58503.1 hypothetical protein A7X12_05530 [Sphingomonas sp. TDK1]
MSKPARPNPNAKQQAAEARCAAMVHHARTLIAERGVESMSVNEVLRLSGGSKATLVKYFGGRDGLISAAIDQEVEGAMALLRFADPETASLPLADGLRQVLGGVLRFYMLPASLKLYRAVVAIGVREPGTAAAFYDHGHRVLVDAIAAFLRGHAAPTKRETAAFADMADQILHAIRAGLHERAVLGLETAAVEQATIDARVGRALDLLLPGIEAALHD